MSQLKAVQMEYDIAVKCEYTLKKKTDNLEGSHNLSL